MYLVVSKKKNTGNPSTKRLGVLTLQAVKNLHIAYSWLSWPRFLHNCSFAILNSTYHGSSSTVVLTTEKNPHISGPT